MSTLSLPYAKLDFIDRRIVVVEIKQGVDELTRDMVLEMHRVCQERCEKPYVVISNKRASYSLSFEAAQETTRHDELLQLISVIPDPSTRNTLHWFLKMHPRYLFCDTLEQAIDLARQRVTEYLTAG